MAKKKVVVDEVELVRLVNESDDDLLGAKIDPWGVKEVSRKEADKLLGNYPKKLKELGKEAPKKKK